MFRCDIVRKMTMTMTAAAARLHHVYRVGIYKNAFLDCIILLRIGMYSWTERASSRMDGDGMYVRERIADAADADCDSPAASITAVSGV